VPQAYAQEEIATGRLVQVLDKPWPARFAYYAVTRPGAADRPEVRLPGLDSRRSGPVRPQADTLLPCCPAAALPCCLPSN
jgi:DNA-binding transcriptional LysR family regulator